MENPVGADAHIGPRADGIAVYVFSDRSDVIPHGAMRASPPTLGAHVFAGADVVINLMPFPGGEGSFS